MEEITLDSVDKYNKLYGLETLHPLVAVVDLKQAKHAVNHMIMHYGLYTLYLKNSVECSIKYGRKSYDYQEGTIVSFAPGQTVEFSTNVEDAHPNVLGILFHPDLIRGTSLGQNIHKYSFFSYASTESLHLSERERTVIEECFNNIKEEIMRPIDRHSKTLISMNIELMLNYCLRYYERQFITRERSNQDALQAFEKRINEYFDHNLQLELGLPSVKYFADKAHLTPNYFGDMVKKETGKSAQEFIQFKLIERAKDRLISTDLTISEIAYELGFGYPQHFSRLFKQIVGTTPNGYRNATN